MAFGLLQSKWSVLQKPLQTSLVVSGKVLEACARLHNYCINKDLAVIELISSGEKSSQEALDAYFADMQAVPESPLGWG